MPKNEKCQQIECLKEPLGQPQSRYHVCAVTNPIWRLELEKDYYPLLKNPRSCVTIDITTEVQA